VVTNIFQVIVITVLAFVLLFGIGFILNMLLKTTWFTVYAYVALMVGMYIYFGWSSGNLIASIADYGLIDWLAFFSGLLGAYVSGLTIRALRVRGFKMF
jgi:hypothetical protein